MPIPDHWPPHVRKRARTFLALWKYYRFSRTLSEACVPFVAAHRAETPQNRDDAFRGIAFLSYWISSLEVLSEGWTDLGLKDSAIDPLLSAAHRETLRKYRHTIFHFQADLDEKRLMAMTQSHEAVGWVFDLAAAYQDFFEHHSESIDVEHIRSWLFAPAG